MRFPTGVLSSLTRDAFGQYGAGPELIAYIAQSGEHKPGGQSAAREHRPLHIAPGGLALRQF